MNRIVFVALLLLVSCGGSEQAPPPPEVEPAWVTIEGIEFPAEMARAPAGIQEAYVFAAKHPEILRYMPCYCGCEREEHSHSSSYDCFVDAIDRSGNVPRIDPDPMGYG